MRPGYLYILSNAGMPGLVKIGRTERLPQSRAKELQTTGVPHPFVIEFTLHVSDCHLAERGVHQLLQRRGVRATSDREFFYISIPDAIEVIQLVTCGLAESGPDFSLMPHLEELALSVSVPEPFKEVSATVAESTTATLATIARRGYPFAMKQCALIYVLNHPSGPRFKDFWREYLELARAEAVRHLIVSSNGREVRARVGREAATYLELLERHNWLIEDDLAFLSKFLVDGDQAQYEGYVQELSRLQLSPELRRRAADL